jgi:hypothetical protein
MKRIAPFLTIVVVAFGCTASRAPTSQADGYRRTSTPAGCFEHLSERDRNLELAVELETQLLALLGPGASDPTCWYERSEGTLLVTIGGECGPHRRAEFQRVANAWTLAKTEDVPLVLCHERIR